jgi:hypothetical protein
MVIITLMLPELSFLLFLLFLSFLWLRKFLNSTKWFHMEEHKEQQESYEQ